MQGTAALLLALIAAASLAAEVYTWRDASGKIHYSDMPPASAEARKLRTGPGGEAAPAPPQRSLADQEMEFRKRRSEAEAAGAKADSEKVQAETARRNCEQASAQLATLESGQRMTRISAQGEAVVLDDAMRAQEIEKARKSVREWCR